LYAGDRLEISSANNWRRFAGEAEAHSAAARLGPRAKARNDARRAAAAEAWEEGKTRRGEEPRPADKPPGGVEGESDDDEGPFNNMDTCWKMRGRFASEGTRRDRGSFGSYDNFDARQRQRALHVSNQSNLSTPHATNACACNVN
jgi:hypothetical protein